MKSRNYETRIQSTFSVYLIDGRLELLIEGLKSSTNWNYDREMNHIIFLFNEFSKTFHTDGLP